MEILEDKKSKIKQILDNYRKAGDISKKAKKLGRKLVVPGANVYEICETIEDLIRKEGGKPAFPTNVSINNEAAHYSAEILDDRVIPENSITKLDLGVHIDGYIVDTAITLNYDPKLEILTQAAKDALYAALNAIRPGVKVEKIGRIVEKIINKAGYKPVMNLSGHQIKRYNLHAGLSIPNVGPGYFERDSSKFELGRIYAVEPFASTGKGLIDSDKITNIFRLNKEPKKKDAEMLRVYHQYKKKVGILPFSPRMVHDKSSGIEGKKEVEANIQKMLRTKSIVGYAVLAELKKSVRIAQFEHTVRVTKKGVEIFTLEDEDIHLAPIY